MEQLKKLYHHLWDVAQLAFWLFHIKALSKAKITQDVKHQVVDPVSHVERFGPAIFTTLLAQQLEPSVHVCVYEDFCRTHCLIGESLVEHPSLSRMYMKLRAAPCIDGVHVLRPHLVIVALLHVTLGTENRLVCGRGVNENAIGPVSEFWAYNMSGKMTRGNNHSLTILLL